MEPISNWENTLPKQTTTLQSFYITRRLLFRLLFLCVCLILASAARNQCTYLFYYQLVARERILYNILFHP